MPKPPRAEELEREIAHVRELRSMVPSGSFGDGGLGYRLAQLEAELATLPEEQGRTATFSLIFSGDPVFRSVGIDPRFAGRSLSEFDRLVDAHLPPDAEVPGRFLLTETIEGSFGFRLEEVGQTQLVGESDLARAVDAMSNTIAKLTAEDLDAEWFGALDAGVVHAAKSFFEVLAQHHARVRFVSAQFEATVDPDTIELAKERVEQIRIEEDVAEYLGVLKGLRLESRDFDFVADDGSSFRGMLDQQLDVVRAKKYFDKKCRVRIRTVARKHPSGRTTKRNSLLWVDGP